MAVVTSAPAVPALPSVPDQLERLRSLGIEVDLDHVDHRADGALVALAPGVVPVAQLAQLLTHRGKTGFVVEDMTDVEDFGPTVELPATTAYLVTDVDRGDDLLGWKPADALPELQRRGRSPLTLQEGLSWLLQVPEALADNHCFMTIGSRKAKLSGGRPSTSSGTAARYDARTPAIWISRGTGRDGSERRHAPKVGWCWWNNHHTWLGFASCASRDL